MILLRLILAEAWSRRLSSALIALAVAAACASVVFFAAITDAIENETRVVQRDIGLNVLIIPAATNLDRYWALGYADQTMPEAYIDKVADQRVANRLVPLLQRRVTISTAPADAQPHAPRTAHALLTGLAAETFIDRKMKAVFGMQIQPGRAVLGSAAAAALDAAPGDAISALARPLTVDRVLAQTGAADDARVYVDLAEAQAILDLPGRINEIQAIECHCSDEDPDPLATLRAELEPLLPGTQIIRRTALADARNRQRGAARRLTETAVPVLVALAALFAGALMTANVRDRKREIGVLRAIGRTGAWIAAAFLGRAALLGLIGGAAGALAGSAVAHWAAERVFLVTARLSPDAAPVALALLAAPIFAALTSLIPAALAATEDPAACLRAE